MRTRPNHLTSGGIWTPDSNDQGDIATSER